MGFLGALADQISSQFSLGENTNHTLDAVDPISGKVEKYGSLGDFAKKFDQSAERRYVEEGYLRRDPYNTDPKQFEVLLQEPNATVLIKKKMFSSVGDNFRPDFMDADEKLYYKAMRILFQNKCAQIGALEKLSKIQKITSSVGSIPNQMIPLILSTSDDFFASLSPGSNLFGSLGGNSNPLAKSSSTLSKATDKLRRFYAFNITNPNTTWITDSTNLFQSQFGQGTGVIEITNFTNFNTSVSTEINNPGSFGLSIADPYESMLITEYDIEKAISDATNMFYNSKVFQFAKESGNKLINDLTSRLNHIRANRGAGPISIKLEPDTLLGKRVRAIIDRKGIEIPFDYDSSSAESLFSGGAFGGGATVPPEYLKDGSAAGIEGLDPNKVKFNGINAFNIGKHSGPDSEVSLFSRLISTIFSRQSQEANSQNAFQTMNKKTNYTRRKLRFNFSGKLIIQPMDIVHIYINSKSRFDNKLLSGLQNMFSGLGVLQNLNNTITGVSNAVDTLFRPSGSIPLQIEKSAFVGSDFPNPLWSLIRGSFITENEGTHVFGGVVQNASDNWSDGKFTVEVSGKDNSVYFDQGRVNFKPGQDNFNGIMFDPLTPFKSEFDTVSSNNKYKNLLLENQSLLGSPGTAGANRRSLIKHKLGRYAGELVTADNIIQDRSVDPVTGRITKIFYAPDGLVYKWKEGIGVFTQVGSNLAFNDPNRSGSSNINKEPFAGQDVMNVLSLLITGQPYNFYNYFKTTRQFDNFGNDPQSKQNAAHSYTLSLRNDLIKNNTLWGNFIPFKNLVIDEASYSHALSTQASITQKNQVLDEQLNKLRDLNKIAIASGAINALSDTPRVGLGPPGSKSFPQLLEQVSIVKAQVLETQKAIQNESDAFFAKNNRDISSEATEFIDPQKIGASVSDASIRKTLRRKLNFLTRRMSYNVRANEDKNLFIVDDFYDKDLDILAFEKSLGDSNSMQLYNSDYTSIRDKIALTANLLNLEVFCDTQGHIRCRPPQYNRMPSSVFYRMMYLKDVLNIQIFPQFLDDLFNTKLETLKARLEIIEDQIRLDCAILNHKSSMDTDADAILFIISSNPNGGSFSLISDPKTGEITRTQDLILAANPDKKARLNFKNSEAITEFNKIKGSALSTKNPFSSFQKYQLTIKSLTKQLVTKDGIPVAELSSGTQNVIDELVKRIYTKSGQRVDTKDYLATDVSGIVGVALPAGVSLDVFKVTEEISSKIAERQKVLKLFYNTIKNAQEYKSLDEEGERAANRLLTPGIYGKDDIPEVFEHMIEDESYDDYGPGSGTRFIIKRAQIKNISISENPPPFTSIEVQGVLNQYDPKALPSGLNAFPGGGNGMVTALAVDYDMWRNYGFRESPVLSVPFLQDPVSQCGPYAAMLLSRNRKNLLKGTVTISGNEFMQPGEVVFIEDRQLLFYVTSVKHNFTFGSNFTTTLDLTYGHTAGEYIPTVMDMIGKMIYNNKDVAETAIHRQDTSANELSIGVIQLVPNAKAGKPGESININAGTDSPQSPIATANAQIINNILFTTAYKLNAITSSSGNTATAKIELRTYYDKNIKSGTDLNALVAQVRQVLIGQNMPGLSAVSVTKQGIEPTSLSESDVIDPSKSKINLDDPDNRKSPSQYAFDTVRNILNVKAGSDGGASPLDNNSILTGDNPTGTDAAAKAASDEAKLIKNTNDRIRTTLIKNIIDCWITVIPNDELPKLGLDKK